ncbi:hypothetical protein P3S68_028335 [Capsicum galapagoense]
MLGLKENKYEGDKSRGMKHVENIQKINLPNYPEIILFNILVKIPPRDIHKNVMPICKQWKEIVSGGYFIEQNFTELKLELVIQSGLGRHKKTKSIKIGKELECESLELGLSKLRKIHSSCGGFLLMSEPGDCGKLQLINPAKKFCLTIPRCPSLCPHKACSAALAFDSWTKQYKVVHVVTDSYGFEIFNLCGGDDEHWERVPGPWEDLNDRPFDLLKFFWKDPVSINRRLLHWHVDSTKYFISMQVEEEKFSRISLPEGAKVISKTNGYALIDLGGFLSFINCNLEIKMDVWILEDFRGRVENNSE